MDDNYIENMLNEISNTPEYVSKANTLEDSNERTMYKNSLIYMGYELKLIHVNIFGEKTIVLTEKGKEVIGCGGWIKYKELKGEEYLKTDQKLNAELRLTTLNIEADERNRKDRRINNIGTIVNIAIGIINIIVFINQILQ